MKAALGAAALALLAAPAAPPSAADALARIQAEAAKSQVMDIAWTLTDVYGARLTGSPSARAAGEYVQSTLAKWGIARPRLEPWHFGPGWSNERFWIRMVEPQPASLIGYPRAWTPSTPGAVRGLVVLVKGEAPRDLDTYKGTLKGKFVIVEPDPERPETATLPEKFSDADLAALAQPPAPGASRPARMSAARREFNLQRDQLFVTEGALAALEPSRFVSHGTVLVARSGQRRPLDPPIVPTAVLAIEHYNRIVRLLEKGVSVQLEMESTNGVHSDAQDAFNVVSEIPGTDKREEIVLMGGHLDSWHSGTGATDNAAGCAVMMEALRILKATGLPLRRTVRLALWTGEEQSLLGAHAYVAEHIGNRATMALKPGHAQHDVYFNLDAGAGAIRGVFLQGNEKARSVIAEWLRPVAGLGAGTVSIRNSQPGGSDHQAFDEIGVPGFQFIQDPGDYEHRTHTHHTNMDVYEALDADTLKRNAIIVAAVVYQGANSDQAVPREPLPSPAPASSSSN
jgi:carboxypeptidase Q